MTLDDLLAAGTRVSQLTPYTETGPDGPLPSIERIENVENLSLVIGMNNRGAGDLTGGHPSNTMRVKVWYAVMPCLIAPAAAGAVPAGSLAFSGAESQWVFLTPDGATRLSDFDTVPVHIAETTPGSNSGVFNGGFVALDTGQWCVVNEHDDSAHVFGADLSFIGSLTLTAVAGAASNRADGFFTLDGTSIVRINTAAATVATWTGVGNYTAIGVTTDSAVAYVALRNDDHVDVYDLAGSSGPTTFVTESGVIIPFGGSMVQVCRDGRVLVGWNDPSAQYIFAKLYDASGATLNTFNISAPGDNANFFVWLTLAPDDASFWVGHWVDALSVVRVEQIRFSDGAVLHTFDKTSAELDLDNAAMAVAPVAIA